MLDDKRLSHPYTRSFGAANRLDTQHSLAYQDDPSLAPFPTTPVLVNASPWPPRQEIRSRSNTIETKIITLSSH